MSPSAKMWLWLTFLAYVVVAVFTMMHHELWGDELHSWNMAKASNSLSELMHNRRYEGHPPVWHIILWLITRVTHDPVYMQYVHVSLAIIVVYLVLFRSSFPLIIRVLIPFGYYFLYEYAILSRNYIPAILCAFLLCIVLHKRSRYRLWMYYSLLLIMSQTHLLGLILAGCIHLYFLLSQISLKRSLAFIAANILSGLIILAIAIYFIKPPADSELSIGSWFNRWNASQLMISIQAPLRAFLPMPAWWKYHFWNQQFLLALNPQWSLLKIINPLLALFFVLLGAYVLKNDRKSLLLFLANTILTFIAGNIYPLTTQRYTGFIFIGFVVALWLYCYHKPLSTLKKKWIGVLLIAQIAAGVFIVFKDITLPFSNAYKAKEVIVRVPANATVVTDYWALSALSAYTDRSYYCADVQKDAAFMLWGNDMAAMRNTPERYYNGIKKFMDKNNLKEIYLVSTSDSFVLYKIDPRLFSAYKIGVAAGYEGAIEKWSNLYVYHIVPK